MSNETKTRSNCIFQADRDKHMNGCYLLYERVPCIPERCVWHMTHQQRIESYANAARIWMQNHPGKNWDMQDNLVPSEFRYEVKKLLRMKENG